MKYILTSLAIIGTITLTPSYTAELTCTQIIKDTENIKKVLAIEAYEATGNSLRYMKRIEDIQATIKKGKTYRQLLQEWQEQNKDCYINLESNEIKYLSLLSLRDFLLLIKTLEVFDRQDYENKDDYEYLKVNIYKSKAIEAYMKNQKEYKKAMQERINNTKDFYKDKGYKTSIISDYRAIIEYSGIYGSPIYTKYRKRNNTDKAVINAFYKSYNDIITNALLIQQRIDKEEKAKKDKEEIEEAKKRAEEELKARIIDKNKVRIVCKYDDSSLWFQNATIYKCKECKGGYEAKIQQGEGKELYPAGRKKLYGIDKRYIDILENKIEKAIAEEYNKVIKEILENEECKIIERK